ncbi:MAG: deoxyribose-phosphate aldolase [Nitrososphaerales archaeon]
MALTADGLAKRIDHTLIRPTVIKDEIKKLCEEAKQYNFRAVSINLSYLPLVYDMLKNSNVKIGTTIGFPFGMTSTKTKVSESKEAIHLGANELDTVINIGYLKSGDLDYIRKELISLVEMVKSFDDITIKIIIETGYLSDDEKFNASIIAKEAKVDFIKTSTGIGTSGATVDDIKLIRKIVGNTVGIKAAGGIDTYEKALHMINAGADIIGTSHAVAIMNEAMKRR